jgi:hypothetical protein
MGPLAFLGNLRALAAFSDSGGTLAPSPRGRVLMRGVAVCRRLSPSTGASVLTIARFLSASRRLGSADARCTTPATHDNLSFEAQSRGSHTRCLRFAAFLPALSRSYGHARLASGWWPAFTGRGSRPRKAPNEVSASSTWLPPHPSFATQATSELDSALQLCNSHRVIYRKGSNAQSGQYKIRGSCPEISSVPNLD